MKKLINFIAVFLLISFPSQAEVRLLQEGDKAPYKGYLFDIETEKKIRIDLLQLDYYKALDQHNVKIIKLMQDNEDLMNKRIELYQKQNLNLNEQLASSKDINTIERIVWFGLGILATGFAFYGARQLAK